MTRELTTRLVARTKALGLVAATAMVTTALAGGGVVAVSVVSNEKPAGQQQAGVPGEQRSDTATATIGGKPTKSPRPGKPSAPACIDAKNHGAFVSGVARSAAPGPSHGPLVSAAAKDDCGKAAKPTKSAKPPKPTRTGRPDSPGKSAGKGKSDSAGRD
mgnify:CR=1 FL=1